MMQPSAGGIANRSIGLVQPAVLDAPATPPEVQAAEDRLAGDCAAGYAVEVLEHVRPAWLYGVRQRRVLERSAALLAAGREVDLVALCEGQDRDAVLFASTIIDASVRGTNLRYLADLVRRDWRRREAIDIGRDLASGSYSDHKDLNRLSLRLLALSDEDEGQSLRIARLSKTGRELLTHDIPPLVPLVGATLMVEGGMTLIVGHSGLGKTFLALQLMHAVAQGTPWLDLFWTDPNGRRVGLLELEMPEASIRDRISRLHGDWVDEASFLCMPDLVVDIGKRETQDEIIAWIKAHRLAMIIMDPANALHTMDENKAVDMAQFMAALKRIKAKTRVHIVLLHHVNKGQQDVKASEATPRTVVLNMVRGSGRLGNDPDNVFGLLEAPGGRVRLVFAKTRHSPSPADPYLRRNEHGFFDMSEAIQSERANKTDEKIEKYLLTRHTPATLAEIAKAIGMSPEGTKKRIVKMGQNVASTQGRPRRYAIATSQLIDQLETVVDCAAEVNDEPF